MSAPFPSHAVQEAFAAHLLKRRDAILDAWRGRIERDRAETAVAHLTRAEFFDHIPAVLNALHARLRRDDAGGDGGFDDAPAPDRQTAASAAAHGAHRWQQGFDLQEMSREWGHLHRTLIGEINTFSASRPATDPAATAAVRDLIAALVHEGVAASIGEFYRLQRLEAAARAQDIEAALTGRIDHERRRGEDLRDVSLELAGGLSLIRASARSLAAGVPDDACRADLLGVILAASDDLDRTLADLRDLSRLEAGLERRRDDAFDAADLLRGLCVALRPLADVKGLTLAAHGPATFAVRGDRDKVRRIARHLLLIALKFTDVGGVEIVWRSEEKGRWGFAVRDTGRGTPAGTAAALEAELTDATTAAHSAGDDAGTTVLPGQADLSDAPDVPPGDPAPPADPLRSHGEGIGLSIVRRLCELLDATLELDSRPNRGSTFRVLLPRDPTS